MSGNKGRTTQAQRTTNGVLRVALPSGGWWELDSDPTWGKVAAFLDALKAMGDAASSHRSATLLLASFTAAWSFAEPVSIESIGARKASDYATAYKTASAQLAPFFEALSA